MNLGKGYHSVVFKTVKYALSVYFGDSHGAWTIETDDVIWEADEIHPNSDNRHFHGLLCSDWK